MIANFTYIFLFFWVGIQTNAAQSSPRPAPLSSKKAQTFVQIPKNTQVGIGILGNPNTQAGIGLQIEMSNKTSIGIYSDCVGRGQFAGLFRGNLGLESGSLELSQNAIANRFALHLGDSLYDFSFNISPYDHDAQTLLINRRWSLQRNGTATKYIDNINAKAFTVFNSQVQKEVFQVFGDGKVYATEIEVKPYGEFPDYVFSPDYALMPLADLQTFIQKNKHLPNFPNATEVQTNGFQLGQMSQHLVEKVEELHLYILDLDTRLKAQEQTIEQQNRLIEQLLQALKQK
jgi:hypothetical protein